MRDNATVIYLVRESNIIYCWWSFTRFVSLFASKLWYPHRALEKRETEDSGGDGDDGSGFPWIDDGDPAGKTPEENETLR